MVGYAYDSGEGVVQNYPEAFKWYGLAANQGQVIAQYSLGILYANGRGTAQDYVEAHKWFNLAGANGDKDAPQKRNLVEEKMTREQLAEAQQRAAAWKPSQTDKPRAPETRSDKPQSKIASAGSTPLQNQGGTFVVPVIINNAITLNFVVDSGAADVAIPADVVRTLMRTGSLRQEDFLGKKTYVLADGTKVPSQTFRIRSMKVGNRTVENVTGSVSSMEGTLLLGQSFLKRFKSWSIDNHKHVLLLE